ncbi:hypothetical protein [Nitratiruptor sp. SB155-2]|uniref:hypothetical protein n=1 Tax=Nitratiruptor sp. (strain SB155-2) TaxID=387092 RepID=UPI0001586F6D|nr:hypothetical protein [Nitratiruptor sp. SB155-2]BAF69292.1 hypothetical protein NIS_0178 [Nitratiruptor sp. SB155-2]
MKLVLLLISSLMAYASIISVGEFEVCYKKNTIAYKASCKHPKEVSTFLQKQMPNVNSVTLWITHDWQEDWYPAKTVTKMIKKGYVPLFIFYYFGDLISPDYVKKHQKRYLYTLQRFIRYLQKIKGKKIVVLNPEYNENGMSNNTDFDLLNTISIIKIKQHVKDALVGPCVGDFGDYKTIKDLQNWNTFENSLHFSAKVADFIAFQEMRALTRNSKKEILLTPQRIKAFASFLYQKYHKPTLLAYLAISSYHDSKLQSDVLRKWRHIFPTMQHFLGFGWFNLVDVPTHTGYFGEAEKHWGVIEADGEKKPSFFILQSFDLKK